MTVFALVAGSAFEAGLCSGQNVDSMLTMLG